MWHAGKELLSITLTIIILFAVLLFVWWLEFDSLQLDSTAQVLHTYEQGDAVYQYINLYGTKCVTVYYNDKMALSCHGD